MIKCRILHPGALVLLLAFCLPACTDSAEPNVQSATPSTNTPAVQPVVPRDTAGESQPATAVPATEMEPVASTTFIAPIGGEGAVARAQSTLIRMEHGIYMTFETADLEPGEAYTIWWVIFNRPENCTNDVCGVDDMAIVNEEGERVLTDEGAPQPNLPQREATQFSLLRAVGSIVDEDGTAEFRAHLPVADTTEADFGPGLLDPFAAEVHLVARTHGMAIPGAVHEQLNSAWGGCPEGWPKDPCRDTQVAIHNAPEP